VVVIRLQKSEPQMLLAQSLDGNMEEIEIKSSFITWLDGIDAGVTAVIALTLNSVKSYEAVYWTDGVNETISIDPEFLILFEVDYEEELPFYHDLLEDIITVLPKAE
jgi:hypothetical protein